MSKNNDKKYQKLLLSLVMDGLGVLTSSYAVILLGDFADVVWAPLAGYAMTKMYKGNEGKIAGAVTFIEEAIPGTDLVPTFTLMWIYTYVIQGKKKTEEIIDIDIEQ
ncbi:hypothetical protein ACFQ1M_05575 [Sungkyunkwania multivorans]|uniref:Uncharacterized protein n=1 Tax=Sungkyunkwania multivorans TaxID=1173618 RepID=A0ABW3CVC4_9FLAO